MTNDPILPPPSSGSPTATDADAILDRGSYGTLRTPRSAAALRLDGTWHQISPRYVVVRAIVQVLGALVVAAAMLYVGLVGHQPWAWAVGGVLLVVDVIALVILPRQARAMGYSLRTDDVVFRRGILWLRFVAVPYGRLQLVDISQGPVDRLFGICQLKLVTAASSSGVQIPGLVPEAAEALRDRLIAVAETRRTGL